MTQHLSIFLSISIAIKKLLSRRFFSRHKQEKLMSWELIYYATLTAEPMELAQIHKYDRSEFDSTNDTEGSFPQEASTSTSVSLLRLYTDIFER